MKLSDYAQKLGVCYRTAWNHFKQGLIPGAYQLPTGTVIVPDKDEPKLNQDTVAAVYCRVSSSENKDNLESQCNRVTQYCTARGYRIARTVKETGSGVNDQRKQFLSLIKDSAIDVIVVEHRDRSTRFGFNYVQELLKSCGRRIEVINEADNNKNELMEDLIAIITSFTARYYGQRRSKRKTEKIIQELTDDKD